MGYLFTDNCKLVTKMPNNRVRAQFLKMVSSEGGRRYSEMLCGEKNPNTLGECYKLLSLFVSVSVVS